MKLSQKQRRIWMSVAAVAAVSLVALWVLERPSGPTYKGKTVAGWLDQLPPNSAISTNVEVSGMLMALGSNAVPALVHILDEGSSWRLRLRSAMARQGWIPATLRARSRAGLIASASRMAKAVDAFDFLGAKARAALPELERIASRPNDHISPFVALQAFDAVATGTDTFPAIIRIATNTPALYRPNVDIWLKNLLYRSDLGARLQAALALCELGSPPPDVIPPLVQCIGSVRSPHKQDALQALAKLAPQYAAARDAIREASADEDPAIRELAKAVLDQQMAAKPSKTN
jgi:hypothetical protein